MAMSRIPMPRMPDIMPPSLMAVRFTAARHAAMKDMTCRSGRLSSQRTTPKPRLTPSSRASEMPSAMADTDPTMAGGITVSWPVARSQVQKPARAPAATHCATPTTSHAAARGCSKRPPCQRSPRQKNAPRPTASRTAHAMAEALSTAKASSSPAESIDPPGFTASKMTKTSEVAPAAHVPATSRTGPEGMPSLWTRKRSVWLCSVAPATQVALKSNAFGTLEPADGHPGSCCNWSTVQTPTLIGSVPPTDWNVAASVPPS
mmetsp:Transcript_8557/g.33828  ORF Transcript_8557/g.33828 Transcript_8557/m.33828 type:complete len:261 (+) Transcript_8557:1716-2498(+)